MLQPKEARPRNGTVLQFLRTAVYAPHEIESVHSGNLPGLVKTVTLEHEISPATG